MRYLLYICAIAKPSKAIAHSKQAFTYQAQKPYFSYDLFLSESNVSQTR
jgi:hypothetical protein